MMPNGVGAKVISPGLETIPGLTFHFAKDDKVPSWSTVLVSLCTQQSQCQYLDGGERRTSMWSGVGLGSVNRASPFESVINRIGGVTVAGLSAKKQDATFRSLQPEKN